MSQELKVNVKEIKNNKEVEIPTWDELVILHRQTTKMLLDMVNNLRVVIDKSSDIIDNDDELKRKVSGAIKVIEELKKEQMEIAMLHTDPKTKKLKMGKINIKDTKENDLYLYLVMAYHGFVDKLTNALNNIVITLTGEIAEKAEKMNSKKRRS